MTNLIWKQRVFSGLAAGWIGVLLRLGSAFLLGVILARLLSEGEFGIYRTIIASTAVLSLLVNFGFDQSLYRYGSEFFADNKLLNYWRLLWTLLLTRIGASIVLILLLLIFESKLLEFFKINDTKSDNIITALSCLFFLVNLNALIGFSAFGARLASHEAQFILSARDLLALLTIPLILVYLNAHVMYAVWGKIIFEICASLTFIALLFKWRSSVAGVLLEKNKNIFFRFRFWRFSLLNYVTTLSVGPAARSVEQLLVGLFFTTKDVAFYSIGVLIASIISQANPAMILRNIIQPVILERSNYNRIEAVLKDTFSFLVALSFLFSFPILLFLFFSGEAFIAVVFTEKYIVAYDTLVWLLLAATVNSLVSAFSPVLQTLEKPEYSTIAGVFVFIGLLLGLTLIPYVGIKGLAIGAFFDSFFRLIYYVYISYKKLNVAVVFPFKALKLIVTYSILSSCPLAFASQFNIDYLYQFLLVFVAVTIYISCNIYNSPFYKKENDLIYEACPEYIQKMLRAVRFGQ